MNSVQAFSVSQINEYIKSILESSPVLSDIWVVGEISNFKSHYSTGHLYFSLKDETAIIKCVMFRSSAQRLRFVPEDGMRVLLHGKISSYVARGEYQIYADGMQPDGVGALAKAFEQLKLRLGAEGLFDAEHKREIPMMPTRVGVITSASGAAIHDILNVSGRRSPMTEIVIYPAQVQGDTAARSLCGGIRYFNEKSPVDVIIIGRGGGSIEDLWAFNDEQLARLIYDSRIPVISAVGHETDFTICDFVADLRAPTPSAAAEIAFPDIMGLLSRVNDLRRVADTRMARRLTALCSAVKGLDARLRARSPEHVLRERMMHVGHLCERLDASILSALDKRKGKLAILSTRLNAADPLSLMSRGYAVVQGDRGVISSTSDVDPGDRLRISFADGCIEAVVEKIEKEN